MAGNTRSKSELVRLMEAAAIVAGQTDFATLLYTVIETGMELTGASYGALGVLDEAGNLQEFLHVGIDRDTTEAIGRPPEGKGLLGAITREQDPVRLDRISDHESSIGFPEHHPIMETFLGVSIRLGDELFGNLYLTEKKGGFDEDDVELVTGLAAVAGTAIHTARLQRRLRRLAVVEDRERIARDLHDAIIQDLFAVGLSLEATRQKIQVEDVRRVIADTIQQLDETIASLRRFIFDLQPPAWSQRDMRSEASRLIDQLAEPHDVQLSVTFEGKLDDLDPATVHDALQLLKEAVSNALRHAEVDRVEVRVIRDRDELLVIVSDAGKGFDLDAPTSGMGLANIRDRTRRRGGDVDLVSDPGMGTTVRVRLPV
jgi:signal transduction histidine kinase